MSGHHRHEDEPQQETGGQLSPRDRLRKMVAFWMHHHEEHGRSYREWANRARDMGLEKAALILKKLAAEAVLPNQDLEKVLLLLKART